MLLGSCCLAQRRFGVWYAFRFHGLSRKQEVSRGRSTCQILHSTTIPPQAETPEEPKEEPEEEPENEEEGGEEEEEEEEDDGEEEEEEARKVRRTWHNRGSSSHTRFVRRSENECKGQCYDN